MTDLTESAPSTTQSGTPAAHQPTLPPEVEEALSRLRFEDYGDSLGVLGSDFWNGELRGADLFTLHAHITAQAEEIERLRKERPRIPSNGHAMLDLLDEVEKYKAQRDWLCEPDNVVIGYTKAENVERAEEATRE